MKILVAEDEKTSREILEKMLTKAGHAVVAAEDGQEALALIQKETPDMLITDWMMPQLDGLELCRRVRALDLSTHVYVIFLTALTEKERIREGLDAGGDDYITKPFAKTELLGRVKAGGRIIQLEISLRRRNRELSQALAQIRQLKGLLPICMHCKKIRNDKNYWQQIEEYVAEHTEADFSQSVCPDCLEKHYSKYVSKKRRQVADSIAKMSGI